MQSSLPLVRALVETLDTSGKSAASGQDRTIHGFRRHRAV